MLSVKAVFTCSGASYAHSVCILGIHVSFYDTSVMWLLHS